LASVGQTCLAHAATDFRRDCTVLAGAEFPVPALANSHMVRFTLPALSTAEVRGDYRHMWRAPGAA
jgi:hypothetical protein